MAHTQRFLVSFLNTYVAFRHWIVLCGHHCPCQYERGVSSFENHHSSLSHVQAPIEVSCNGLHCASDLDFAFRSHTRLDNQNCVLGIEIDYSVEVLLIDCFVCLFDEQRYWM